MIVWGFFFMIFYDGILVCIMKLWVVLRKGKGYDRFVFKVWVSKGVYG